MCVGGIEEENRPRLKFGADYLNVGNLQRGQLGAHFKKYRMRNILALLCVFLMAAHQNTGLLTKGESIRSTIHIVNIAQITLVHIEKLKLRVSPIEVPTPSIKGLSSISRDLGVLDNELHPFTEVLRQIQTDVSSLEGRVRSLALSMECPLEPKPAVQTDNSVFEHSHLYMTVTKVQHYLENLLLNKEKLQLC